MSLAHYSRRVSFNNLAPDEPESPHLAYVEAPSTHESSSFDPTSFFATSYQNYTTAPRKRLKLPEPPSKLILKNKLSPQQLQYNLQHSNSLGISYHGDLNDLAEMEVPRSVVNDEPEDEGKGRRKSYSNMTDEELMALDPQFQTTKSKVLNVNQFKFDSQKTYYLPNSKKQPVANPAFKPHSIYPSSNENNYKSISLTVKHEDYDKDTLDDRVCRTLLTVVSGRRHTWNSLDWLLLSENDAKQSSQPFLIDGDYLVVSALVPLAFLKEVDNKKRKKIDDILYSRCSTLLNYIMQQLPSNDLKVKITVEFVTDVESDSALTKKPVRGPKYMLHHIYKQYQPTLVIVGNKSTNLNFKYPVKFSKSAVKSDDNLQSHDAYNKYLVKLSSYLIKYSPVPVIVVGNSTKFHVSCGEPKNKPLVTFLNPYPFRDPKQSILKSNKKHSNSDLSETESIESLNGNSTTSSITGIELKSNLASVAESSDEDKFKTMIAMISDSSYSELHHYLRVLKKSETLDESVNDDEHGVLNGKIHDIYTAQLQGNNAFRKGSGCNGLRSDDRMYKVKSLISYNEEDEKKHEKMINNKKIKKMNSASTHSSVDEKAKEPKKGKRRSFLQKIGLKKS